MALYPVIDQPRVDHTPVGDGWIMGPPNELFAAGGLESLTGVTELLILQKFDFCECFTGFERQNKYDVLVRSEEVTKKFYYASETSNCCWRNTTGTIHPFAMSIFDSNTNKEVINIERPFNCQGCCCPCCLQEMKIISSSSKAFLGTINEDWGLLFNNYSVRDPDGQVIMKIKGPIFTCSLPDLDVDFHVFSNTPGMENREIATIVKNWSGCFKECFTDVDNFKIYFHEDIDVKLKALLLGTSILIDFMYYERGGCLFTALGYYALQCASRGCAQFGPSSYQ